MKSTFINLIFILPVFLFGCFAKENGDNDISYLENSEYKNLFDSLEQYSLDQATDGTAFGYYIVPEEYGPEGTRLGFIFVPVAAVDGEYLPDIKYIKDEIIHYESRNKTIKEIITKERKYSDRTYVSENIIYVFIKHPTYFEYLDVTNLYSRHFSPSQKAYWIEVFRNNG